MKIHDFFAESRQISRMARVFFCLSAALLLQTGCTSTPSGSNIGSQHQTFAISMLSPQGTPYERSRVAQLAPVAADAVTTTLTGKGYREVPSENADMLVRLSGKFAPDFKSEIERVTGDMAPQVTVESAQHRVLSIDVLDNRTQKTLWTNSRAGSGDATPPPDRLRAIIADMLAPFPNASP